MRFMVYRAFGHLGDGWAPPAALGVGQTSNGQPELSHAVVDDRAHPNRRVVCRATPEWADAIAAALNASRP